MDSNKKCDKQENRYISDKIKEEFFCWGQGDMVFISSPTGSGKTTFIFKRLLPYYAKSGYKILYFVNRKILRYQLEEEIKKEYAQYQNNIKILTYQKLEEYILKKNYFELSILKQHQVVVCDETHYFLSDSLFNANTDLSFNWINITYSDRVRVFLSATIYDVRKLLDSEADLDATHQIEIPVSIAMSDAIPSETYSHGYSNDMSTARNIINRAINTLNLNNERGNFSYLTKKVFIYNSDICNESYRIDYIENRNMVVEKIMSDTNNKWLIFVDSIEYGKEIEKDLKKRKEMMLVDADVETEKKYREFEVVFLTADYKKDIDAVEESIIVQKKKMQRANVLIATSVLDNGISLQDCNLKNIILFADNEVEFLQMIGRKRREVAEGEINLFLFKYSETDFKKRLNEYNNICKIHEEFLKEQAVYGEYYQTGMINGYQSKEHYVSIQIQKWLLESLFSKRLNLDRVRKLFRIQDGMMVENTLSVRQAYSMQEKYKSITGLFEKEGEFAYLKQQMFWLGYSDSKVEKNIADWNISDREKYPNEFTAAIENCIATYGMKLTKKQNIKFKVDNFDLINKLFEMITSEEWKELQEKINKKTKDDYLKELHKYKTDHPITNKMMEILNYIYNIPYKLETHRGNKKEGIEVTYEFKPI